MMKTKHESGAWRDGWCAAPRPMLSQGDEHERQSEEKELIDGKRRRMVGTVRFSA